MNPNPWAMHSQVGASRAVLVAAAITLLCVVVPIAALLLLFT